MRTIQTISHGKDTYQIDLSFLSVEVKEFLDVVVSCPEDRVKVVAKLLNLGDKDSLTLAYELSKA